MRVLLKISGEALAWKRWIWFDFDVVDEICEEIKKLTKKGIEVWVVIWWWNLVRGGEIEQMNIDRCNADNMWMLAININSIALADILNKKKVEVKLLNSFAIDWVVERFNKPKAIKALKDKKVIIFAWGTWNPYFTTDTAWVLRALEIEADLMIKATKVDWIYTKDPVEHKDAIFIKKATYDEMIQKNLKVMDSSAIALAKDNNLVLRVISLYDKWAILKVIKWEDIWTTISA